MARTKKCGWCKREKSLSSFYKSKDSGRYRSRCRKCEAAIAKGRYSEDPDNPRLPIGPFARWLDRIVAEIGVRNASLVTGVSQRRIHCVLHEDLQDNVTLDVVDRALVREGSTHLSELYPELYEMEAAA